MTQEERQLLLVDLCMRLPYKPKVKIGEHSDYVVVGIDFSQRQPIIIDFNGHRIEVSCENVQPILRPMSSMTDMERKKLYFAIDFYGEIDKDGDIDASNHEFVFSETCFSYIDWINAHHFDYRGLLEKGLAIEAPEGMYK